MMTTTIDELLDALRGNGAQIELGQPMTPAEVEALQNRLKVELPAEHVAFLQRYGALRVASPLSNREVRVFGHAPSNASLDIESATQTTLQEAESWAGERPTMKIATFCSTSDSPSESFVFNQHGKVQDFWRGEFESQDKTFDDVVREQLGIFSESLEDVLDRIEFQADLLDQIESAIASDMIVKRMREPPQPYGVVVRRPGDGVEIELRFGDGREFGGRADGLFVSWSEPPMSLEEMNAWNRNAVFVRGAVAEKRCRYRGRLPAFTHGRDGNSAELEIDPFLAALAADARLPLETRPATTPTLQQVREALEGHAHDRPEQRLEDALLSSTPIPVWVRQEQDALVLRSSRSTVSSPREDASVEVRVRVLPTGLIRVEHTTPCELPRERALTIVNERNGADMADDDTNLDLEPLAVASLGQDTVTFAFTTTLAALGTDAYDAAISELERSAADSNLLPPRDPMLPLHRFLESYVRREVGPATCRLLASLPSLDGRLQISPAFEERARWVPGAKAGQGGVLGIFAVFEDKAPEVDPVETPWGWVIPLLELGEGDGLVQIGLQPAQGRCTDDCAVIAMRGDQAQQLAPDVPSFVDLLASGLHLSW